MRDSKVFKLLQILSNKELNRFDDFLNSPYHNKNEYISHLFTLLKPYLKNKKSIDEIKIHKKIFPTKKYTQNKFSNTTSNLIQKFEEFIKIEYNEQNLNNNLLLFLSRNKQDDEFEKYFRKYEKELAKTTISLNTVFDYYKHQAVFNIYVHQNQKHKSKKELAIASENYQMMLHRFDHYLIIQKLLFAIEIIALKNVYSLDIPEVPFLEEADRLIIEQNFIENPLVNIYYKCYNLYKNENRDKNDLSVLDNLILLIDTNKLLIAKNELKNFLIILINYCNRKINKGYTYFNKKSWELHLLLESTNVLYDKNIGTTILRDYRNALSVGLRSKKLDATLAFIERGKNQLPNKYAQDCYNYGLGTYHFHKEEYDTAYNYLLDIYEVGKVDLFYEINRRFMIIRILVVQNKLSFEKIETPIDSFRVWVFGQQTIHKNQQSGYINAVYLLKELLKFQTGLALKSNTKALQQFINQMKNKISNYEHLSSKGWFLKIIDKIEKYGRII